MQMQQKLEQQTLACWRKISVFDMSTSSITATVPHHKISTGPQYLSARSQNFCAEHLVWTQQFLLDGNMLVGICIWVGFQTQQRLVG